MLALAALLFGEAMLIGGLAMTSVSAALVVAGAQVVAFALLHEDKP